MVHRAFILLFITAMAAFAAAPRPADSPLLQKSWYELKSPNFRVFSCARTQDIVNVVARLEQFRSTYSSLAGTQAVISPPVIVMVFPDQFSMTPYLPLYGGKPANLSALFVPGTDENWIVTSLSSRSLDWQKSLYHEYAHLLFRHNNRIWPLWLQEGMAEIYSTFQVDGLRGRFAWPQRDYVLLLREQGLMSLQDLVSVSRESPTYNERHGQPRFYSQSWLLAHYLMAGNNPALMTRFRSYTARLRDAEEPLQALTNALGVSVSVLESGLRHYLMHSAMRHIEVPLDKNLPVVTASLARPLTRDEIILRLANQLIRVRQFDKAEAYLAYAKELAPENPAVYESLGLLADENDEPGKAIGHLERAIQLKSSSFLVQYLYGRVKLRVMAKADRPTTADIKPIRAALQRSIQIMPSFGPPHHLLAVLEMVVGGNPATAEQHLQKALQLEPDNPVFLLTLAQVQISRSHKTAARRTLRTVLLPSTDEKLRVAAQELLNRIE